MISAETRRNFNDFNDMYREIELENEEEVDTPDMVVDRVTSEPELDDRRLDDVLRWRDLGYSLDGDVVFSHRSSDPGYGSDYDVDDDDVSDIED